LRDAPQAHGRIGASGQRGPVLAPGPPAFFVPLVVLLGSGVVTRRHCESGEDLQIYFSEESAGQFLQVLVLTGGGSIVEFKGGKDILQGNNEFF